MVDSCSRVMILRQQDENIDELQSTLQEFAVSGRETCASTITFFTRER